MAAEQSQPKGPDLTQGVALNDIADGAMLGGRVGDDAVLLARRGNELFAIGATCSHYGGPLSELPVFPATVPCPSPPPSFSLRTSHPARPSGRRRSIPYRAGARNGATARCSCANGSSLPLGPVPTRVAAPAPNRSAW